MSSGDRTFDYKAGDGNIEAADCLHELKRYFELVNELKNKARIYQQDELPKGQYYSEAYSTVVDTLDHLATFLSDSANRPHIAAPIINPNVATILRYERNQLKHIMTRIREEAELPPTEGVDEKDSSSSKPWYRKIWKWLPKGFNSADIIINSLQNSVPGLSFVGEFKKQLQNLLPTGQP